jgi:hypothetical protein
MSKERRMVPYLETFFEGKMRGCCLTCVHYALPGRDFFCQQRFRSFTIADRCASPFVRTTVAEPTLRFAAALCVTAFLQATTAAGRPRDDWLACELTVRTTTERHPAADESAVQATRSTTFNRLMLRWPKLMWIGGGFRFTGKRVEGDQMIGAGMLRKRLKWKRSGLRSACVRALLCACVWQKRIRTMFCVLVSLVLY